MFWADLFFLSEFCHHKIYTNLVFQIFSNCCFFSFYIFVVILILNTLNWSFDSSSASLDCSSPLPMIVIHNMENRPKEIIHLTECSFFLIAWGSHLKFSKLLAIWQPYVLLGLQFTCWPSNIKMCSLNDMFYGSICLHSHYLDSNIWPLSFNKVHSHWGLSYFSTKLFWWLLLGLLKRFPAHLVFIRSQGRI